MILDLLRFNRALRRCCSRQRGARGESLQRLPRAPPLLARFRRAADRAAGLSPSGRPTRGRCGSFPVRFIAEFFANHGMLGFRDRPRWSTVAGRLGALRRGADRAVPRAHPPAHAGQLDLAPERSRRGRPIAAARSGAERYDHVIIATHSDQALAMLERSDRAASASCSERSPTSPTRRCCTPTARCCPRRRAARSAWNFHLLREPKPLSTVTYYMNHLQRLDAERDFCVTLNRTEAIDPAKIIRTISYCASRVHAARASPRSPSTRDQRPVGRTHYCGAYWGWGFHEDGVRSALRACEPFGVEPVSSRLACTRAPCATAAHETRPATSCTTGCSWSTSTSTSCRLPRRRLLWSARRPALAWFRRADHLGDPRTPLARRVRALVARAHAARARRADPAADAPALLRALLQPRQLLLLLRRRRRARSAVVAHVTNTPVGRAATPTSCRSPTGADHGTRRARAAAVRTRQLHVSPLMGMDHTYELAADRARRATVACTSSPSATAERARRFDATLSLRRRELSARRAARARSRATRC